MQDDVTVGSVIRAVRKAKGVSARELSLRAGLSESYVGKLESGSLEPSLGAFANVATVLNLTAGEIHALVLIHAHHHNAKENHDG